MLKQALILFLIFIGLLFLLPAAGTAVPVAALVATDSHSLGGRAGFDPLQVDILNNGSMAVFFWQPEAPGSANLIYLNRYFDQVAWGCNLLLADKGVRYHFYSDYYQDLDFPASVVPADIGVGAQSVDGDRITTVWNLLDGDLLFRQTIVYPAGGTLITKRYDLQNLGAGVLSEISLLHGGDVFFGEEAGCSWDSDLQMLTVRNLEQTIGGRIAFYADAANPFASWFAGDILDLLDLAAEGRLTAVAAAVTEDAGCLLQWDKETLEPDETWTVTLYEQHADPGPTPSATPQASPTPEATPTAGEPLPTTAADATPTPDTTPTPDEATPTPVSGGEPTLSPAATPARTPSAAPITDASAPAEEVPRTGADQPLRGELVGLALLLAAAAAWLARLRRRHR